MEQQTQSLKFVRQRKFLTVLPMLVTPFVFLVFWALGGGGAANTERTGSHTSTGMNLNLPVANLKDDHKADKLAAYEKAASDSAKIRDLIRSDPYLKTQFDEKDTTGNEKGFVSEKKYTDPNEAKVYDKLDKLNKVLNETAAASRVKNSVTPSAEQRDNAAPDDVAKMQELMKKIEEKNSVPAVEDTELKQLNGMLDKIMDIQHPDRVKGRLQSNPLPTNKQMIYAVSTEPMVSNVSLLDTAAGNNHPISENAFYGLETANKPPEKQNAVPAVVHENQTLVNGAEIRLRTLADIWIDDHLIPANHFVYGTVTLNNERLMVSIKSIQDAGSVYPVKMEVYNMDGQQGIYIPGAITRDVLKQSTDNAIQSVALQSLDPSIGAQAASAGIETAKQLLSKKVKLIKVQVKAGYQLLLQTIK